MCSPFEEHLDAVYRILRYLNANPDVGIMSPSVTSSRQVGLGMIDIRYLCMNLGGWNIYSSICLFTISL